MWTTRLRFLVLGLVMGTAVITLAQSASYTITLPTTPQNIVQWGTTSITAAAALSDTAGNPTAPFVGANGLLWDTTQWVRQKAAALATFTIASTLTSRNVVGAQLVEKSSRWSVYHNPGAGSQATISIAAEGSVRHVVDCIGFSAVATTAPSLTAVNVNLRDGATGAGTILQSWALSVSATTGNLIPPFSACGLNATGTTNTATTLEFSALVTNVIESVQMTGFNIQ